MSCATNTVKIQSIAHGADTFDEPTGGDFDENVVIGENRPGTRIAPCVWLDQYGLRARAAWQGWQTPVVRGTKASLVYTLLQTNGSSTTTVTLANMVAGSSGGDMNSAPHKQTQELVYDSGTSDNYAPISIA